MIADFRDPDECCQVLCPSDPSIGTDLHQSDTSEHLALLPLPLQVLGLGRTDGIESGAGRVNHGKGGTQPDSRRSLFVAHKFTDCVNCFSCKGIQPFPYRVPLINPLLVE